MIIQGWIFFMTMTYQEHLKILWQGVEAWNTWREHSSREQPHLGGVDLEGADLQGVDLQDAGLWDADLQRANLQGADLQDAYLWEVNLQDANLQGANLERARLEGAKLAKVNLQDANLANANLLRTVLIDANLTGTNLENTNLRCTDLRGANLEGTNLRGANLQGANLANANLREANLQDASLTNANLTHTNLERGNLTRTNLSRATMTGVGLCGTVRDDWVIDDITCHYVYWDVHRKQRTPLSRDFRVGEFEKLYRQLPMFSYTFQRGCTMLDAVVMNRVIQVINERHPEFELKLDSFHLRGQPHTKFTVLLREYVAEARKSVIDEYETRIRMLEGQMERFQQALAEIADHPKMLIAISEGRKALMEKGNDGDQEGEK
jgi:uncharacterized protein YjbI with pentapeptide repeats